MMILYNSGMVKVKIISDSKILGGKPIIAGTRISVELIMNFLRLGMSIDDILKEYPELKKIEVLAAIEYVSKLIPKTKVDLSLEERSKSALTLHEISRR